MADDGLRAALAEALPPHQTWCQTIGHFDCCGRTDDDCDCGITESLNELLPTVRAAMDRRAAEELRAAAAEVREQHGTASLAAKWIDARADSQTCVTGELP